MEIGSLIAIGKAVFSPLVNGAKWAWRRGQRARFRLEERKPPFHKIDAIRAARSTLGGNIVAAVPFRNLGSKNIYIAAARRSSDEDYGVRIVILEQAGGAYITKWIGDELLGDFNDEEFQVLDIDGDGSKEVTFQVESYGSGAGSKSLYIYSPRRNILAEVTEFYNSSDAASPDIYPIKIETGDDEKFREAVIKYAHGRGLLQGNEVVDYDLPKFAVLRWHKENGDKRSGRVRTHLYSGEPDRGNSIEDQLEAGGIIWTAYFKGPLYGYKNAQDRHFIAYSPQWVYEWPMRLAFDGKLLWFFCHYIPGLFSFECQTQTLTHYCGYAGRPLPLLELEEWDWTTLIQHRDGLMACNALCKLDEPHTPNQCINDRHRESLDALLARLRDERAMREPAAES